MNSPEIKKIKEYFLTQVPKGVFCTLRYLSTQSENLSVRNEILETNETSFDTGFMVTAYSNGGSGYAATSKPTKQGIKEAIEKAVSWANLNKDYSLIDWKKLSMPSNTGSYETRVSKPYDSLSLKERIDYLTELCVAMKTGDLIVSRNAMMIYKKTDSYYLTSENSEIYQKYSMIVPEMFVVAAKGSNTEQRSHDAHCIGRQGGLEQFDKIDFTKKRARELAEEAIMLLSAPVCPTEKMDLLLFPDQMALQIHESVGHPLEMDRILGDERNFAGTSFVKLDMIGSFQYGSKLMNITFDPTVEGSLASYNYDDDGSKANKEFLIENGVLKRVLGGYISESRTGKKGVSNSRASTWYRPPIDRMANLNHEPGTSSFEDMIRSVRKGVAMKTSKSWSIDDSRNKFQFGCEWGQLIEDGKLTKIVRRANYRGISSTFWRNLKMVGDKNTVQTLGLPHCGKGEPNQVISVGHSTPACLFSDVDVFGGE